MTSKAPKPKAEGMVGPEGMSSRSKYTQLKIEIRIGVRSKSEFYHTWEDDSHLAVPIVFHTPPDSSQSYISTLTSSSSYI